MVHESHKKLASEHCSLTSDLFISFIDLTFHCENFVKIQSF